PAPSATALYTLSLHDALPIFLAVATGTVKDDGGSAADREMVPARDAADRLEHVVGASDHILGEAPAGAEDEQLGPARLGQAPAQDRKSTRLNSSHDQNSYAVF